MKLKPKRLGSPLDSQEADGLDPVFRVTSKVSNNRLRALRERMGLSPRDLAVLAAVNYPLVLDYESFRLAPVSKKTGEWKASAVRLANALRVTPEHLWPDEALAVEQTVFVSLLNKEHFALQPPSPVELLEASDLRDAVGRALVGMKDRERAVIAMRFGLLGENEHTVTETAERLGVSRERARQIEMEALRRLRHPSRAKHLAAFAGEWCDLCGRVRRWCECAEPRKSILETKQKLPERRDFYPPTLNDGQCPAVRMPNTESIHPEDWLKRCCLDAKGHDGKHADMIGAWEEDLEP